MLPIFYQNNNSKYKVIIRYGGELLFILPKRLCKSYLEKSEFSERKDSKENFLRITEDLKDVFHKLGKGGNSQYRKI